jgi:hypothetical protein
MFFKKDIKQNIENIKSIDLLVKVLKKQKNWRKINADIILRIYKYSNHNLPQVKKFIIFSDVSEILINDFVEIVKNESDVSTILTAFSLSLERYAAQQAEIYYLHSSHGDGPQNDIHIRTADFAYQFSILCQPYMLQSYLGMIVLRLSLNNRNIAREWCDRYETMESQLLNTTDGSLDAYARTIKNEIPTLRQKFEQITNEMLVCS